MNNIMAFDVVELDKVDVDSLSEYANIRTIWLERPFYVSKKRWVINNMMSMYRGMSIEEIDKYGATLSYNGNKYTISFLDDSIDCVQSEKRTFGLIVPFEDFPFVIYVYCGAFCMEAYDSLDVKGVYRHAMVYDELNISRVCKHAIHEAIYEKLSCRPSMLDVCTADNGTSLDIILLAFTLLGVQFPDKYNDGRVDIGILSNGFVEVTDG